MTDHDKLREAIRLVQNNADAILRSVRREGGNFVDFPVAMDMIIKAAESTLPETKMVEVWRVEYAKRWPTSDGAEWMPCVYQYTARSMAEEHAAGIAKDGWPKTCIRVTGPHMQEVPV